MLFLPSNSTEEQERLLRKRNLHLITEAHEKFSIVSNINQDLADGFFSHPNSYVYFNDLLDFHSKSSPCLEMQMSPQIKNYYDSYVESISCGPAISFSIDEKIHATTININATKNIGIDHKLPPFRFYKYESLSPSFVCQMSESFQIMKDVWSAIYNEIAQTIHIIAFFERPNTLGFADPRSLGIIFINYDRIDGKLHLLDMIVHEASHIQLYRWCLLHRMHENSNEKVFQTPLRRDLRPANGVLHQYYVLSRLICLWHRLSDHYNRRFDVYDVYREQKSALEPIIRNSIKFTPIGQQLFDEIEKNTP